MNSNLFFEEIWVRNFRIYDPEQFGSNVCGQRQRSWCARVLPWQKSFKGFTVSFVPILLVLNPHSNSPKETQPKITKLNLPLSFITSRLHFEKLLLISHAFLSSLVVCNSIYVTLKAWPMLVSNAFPRGNIPEQNDAAFKPKNIGWKSCEVEVVHTYLSMNPPNQPQSSKLLDHWKSSWYASFSNSPNQPQSSRLIALDQFRLPGQRAKSQTFKLSEGPGA